MYALLNVFDTTAVRNTLRAMLLTALIVTLFVAAYAVTPFVVAAITAVLAAVAHIASVVVAVAVHAALFALACAVRAAVLVALPVVARVLWRMAVAVWTHRYGLLVAAKALCFAGVVVGCFLGAIVVMPLILAAAGKALIVATVMGGAVLSGKVM